MTTTNQPSDTLADIDFDNAARFIVGKLIEQDEAEQQKSNEKRPNYDVADRDYMLTDVACNTDAPDYVRLAFLCYSSMDWNGHYLVNKIEVMAFLGVGDPRNLRRSIKTAVKYGLLDEGSDMKCLKAPRFVSTKAPNAKRRACLHEH